MLFARLLSSGSWVRFPHGSPAFPNGSKVFSADECSCSPVFCRLHVGIFISPRPRQLLSAGAFLSHFPQFQFRRQSRLCVIGHSVGYSETHARGILWLWFKSLYFIPAITGIRAGFDPEFEYRDTYLKRRQTPVCLNSFKLSGTINGEKSNGCFGNRKRIQEQEQRYSG